MDGVNRGNWLHRLTGHEPGSLPRWILSAGGCGCDDAATWSCFAIASLLAGGTALIAINYGYAINGAGVFGLIATWAVIGFFLDLLLIEPCRTTERKARAIARRAKAAAEGVNPPAPNPDALSESN